MSETNFKINTVNGCEILTDEGEVTVDGRSLFETLICDTMTVDTIEISGTVSIKPGSVNDFISAGTVMLFSQSDAPVGWTKIPTPLDGTICRGHTGGGFSDGTGDILMRDHYHDFSHSHNFSHTHSVTFAHTHSIATERTAQVAVSDGSSGSVVSMLYWDSAASMPTSVPFASVGPTSTGGTQTTSGTNITTSFPLKYWSVIQCSKD